MAKLMVCWELSHMGTFITDFIKERNMKFILGSDANKLQNTVDKVSSRFVKNLEAKTREFTIGHWILEIVTVEIKWWTIIS